MILNLDNVYDLQNEINSLIVPLTKEHEKLRKEKVVSMFF